MENKEIKYLMLLMTVATAVFVMAELPYLFPAKPKSRWQRVLEVFRA